MRLHLKCCRVLELIIWFNLKLTCYVVSCTSSHHFKSRKEYSYYIFTLCCMPRVVWSGRVVPGSFPDRSQTVPDGSAFLLCDQIWFPLQILEIFIRYNLRTSCSNIRAFVYIFFKTKDSLNVYWGYIFTDFRKIFETDVILPYFVFPDKYGKHTVELSKLFIRQSGHNRCLKSNLCQRFKVLFSMTVAFM